tara:strand:- start:487 stop:1017 length:531 start_codon:yes stop_codon:yes gene_type:complete
MVTRLKKTANLKKKSDELPPVVRVQGKLHSIIHITTPGGKKHKLLKPLQVEFHPHDALQILIGAAVLAIPVGFTQEVWELAEILSTGNIIMIALLSVLLISSFVYYNFYHGKLDDHLELFVLRVGATYFLSMLVVGMFLLLIGKVYLFTDLALSLKRLVLVSFPASMSAMVSDSLK